MGGGQHPIGRLESESWMRSKGIGVKHKMIENQPKTKPFLGANLQNTAGVCLYIIDANKLCVTLRDAMVFKTRVEQMKKTT
jgi:hypothetical protein